MPRDTDSADRPALTSEVSISPAMVRAGEARLSEVEGLPAAYLVSEVFAAMFSAAHPARERASSRKRKLVPLPWPREG